MSAQPAALPAARVGAAGRGFAARASAALLAGSALLLLAALGGLALGLRVHVEQSGSMAPALERGDLVIVDRIPAARATPGEVIGVRGEDGRVIVHRVRAAAPDAGGRIAITTQGDANPTAERWTIAAGDTVARVRGHVPYAGALADAVRGPAGAAAVLLAAVLLAAARLRAIWSRP